MGRQGPWFRRILILNVRNKSRAKKRTTPEDGISGKPPRVFTKNREIIVDRKCDDMGISLIPMSQEAKSDFFRLIGRLRFVVMIIGENLFDVAPGGLYGRNRPMTLYLGDAGVIGRQCEFNILVKSI